MRLTPPLEVYAGPGALEKLQRQAAAATRYKTLRAQVRELKGQLAAIRFLQNSEHIEAVQGQQQALQLEVDDLVARLHGDEAGLESYKTKQVEIKQSIDDLQQQLRCVAQRISPSSYGTAWLSSDPWCRRPP